MLSTYDPAFIREQERPCVEGPSADQIKAFWSKEAAEFVKASMARHVEQFGSANLPDETYLADLIEEEILDEMTDCLNAALVAYGEA